MDSNNYRQTMNATAVLIGLAGVIAVHVMDLPGKISEVPYLGVMYIGVIVLAGVLMQRIMKRPSHRDYLAVAGLAGAVFIGFVINRTVGMPGATDDIGNWLEPLGLLSLVVEGWLVAVALMGARLALRVEQAAPPIPVASVGILTS